MRSAAIYRVTWACYLNGYIRAYVGVYEPAGGGWWPIESYFRGGQFQYISHRPAYLDRLRTPSK
jgi:hypothetical protein